jgi:hypothetical protein
MVVSFFLCLRKASRNTEKDIYSIIECAALLSGSGSGRIKIQCIEKDLNGIYEERERFFGKLL